MYAQVTNDTIDTITGRPPLAARRLDTGDWVLGLRDADPALQEACGWFPVVETPRPPDTTTERYVRSHELIAGVPTEVWTAVPKTVEEQAAEADEADREAEAQGVRDDFQALKDQRNAAAQSRTDMDPATGLARWTRDITVAGTGDTVRLEQRADHLAVEVRKLHGDIRAMSAMLVRMIRAQRLDD